MLHPHNAGQLSPDNTEIVMCEPILIALKGIRAGLSFLLCMVILTALMTKDDPANHWRFLMVGSVAVALTNHPAFLLGKWLRRHLSLRFPKKKE